ncbi:MAG TPA: asparagine synthase (glutamine-hydrolyzing) [Solirubrobacteraceae bacterium]|nr:asparagine synthase (glutamine-hydrolyzing) [Solirubrobacteraceae bacterium]
MCGIVGAVGLRQEPAPDLVERLLDSIRHRGPDASGHMFRDGTWLGSRRLKILDLRDEANQPMADEATGVVLVYNGEIYNYLELREELERKGHRFGTSGDTEVLLRGYLEWGDELFGRCNGMWALAIRDPRRGGTLLCRDRFGEKPLYLGRSPEGAWWFGSDAATLRFAGAGSGRLDVSRVLNFLLFGDAEDPGGSFFDGISQVKPGHSVLVTDDGVDEEREWWSLSEFARERWGTRPAQPEEIEEAIDRAVRLRLRSDVLVGSSLSGGIDSSTILGSIRSLEPSREIHVFTASFPGQPVDEWRRASRVADEFGAAAHRVEPTLAGFLETLPLLVRRQGGPFDSPSVYAQWCVMEEAASAGVTVLLDGQGADETWGGYRKYVWFAVAEALLRADVTGASDIVRRWRSADDLPGPDPLQVGGLALPSSGRHVARLAFRRLHRWAGPALLDAALVDPQGTKTGGPLLRQAAVADGARVILPRLLRYADRNSMAWSRELRLPFLDLEVVGHAFSTGWRSGFEAGWTKELLRRVAARRLPGEIVWRRGKTAYDVPEADWLPQQPVRDRLGLASELLQEAGIVERGRSLPVSPWRALSLASFLEQSGLAA